MSVEGKHILVTGATSGIGLAAAVILAKAGAELTLLARNPERARHVAQQIAADVGGNAPQVLIADFSSLDAVRAAAAEFLQRDQPLDILLNNAGLISTSRAVTEDGFEETFAVNHLAPFLLTGLLLPRLLQSDAARIISVASNAHEFVRGMNFDDLQSSERYSTFKVYGQSKLANILFTRELARRLQGRPITVNCLHPGAVATGMGTQNGVLGRILPKLLKPFFRTPDGGADTAVYLCESAEIATTTGAYFYNRKAISPKPWAEDDEAALRLWQISEDMVDHPYTV